MVKTYSIKSQEAPMSTRVLQRETKKEGLLNINKMPYQKEDTAQGPSLDVQILP